MFSKSDGSLPICCSAQTIKEMYTHVTLTAECGSNKTEEMCTVDFDANDTSKKTCKWSGNNKGVNITVMGGKKYIKDCRVMLYFFPTPHCFKAQGVAVKHTNMTVEALYAG